MLAAKNLMDKDFDSDFFRGVIDKVTFSEGGNLCFHFINGYKVYRQYDHKEALKHVKKKR